VKHQKVSLKHKRFERKLFFLLPVLLAALFGSLASAQQSQQEIGKIIRLDGAMTVERQSGTVPVKTGDPLYVSDILHNEENTVAQVLFIDRSLMKVFSKSTVRIVEYAFEPEAKRRRAFLALPEGNVCLMVNDLKGFKDKLFYLQTPDGDFKTEGTYSMARVMKGSSSEVTCMEGALELCALKDPSHCITVSALAGKLDGRKLMASEPVWSRRFLQWGDNPYDRGPAAITSLGSANAPWPWNEMELWPGYHVDMAEGRLRGNPRELTQTEREHFERFCSRYWCEALMDDCLPVDWCIDTPPPFPGQIPPQVQDLFDPPASRSR
jgi:hypothetical protein